MKTQFITDSKGKKIAVVLSVEEYNRIVEELEELDDIKAYDRVKVSKSSSVPAALVFKSIENKRGRKWATK
ncbi:MAG: hypothetical protein HY064_08250 [Bacteroidetes bacterium]|nr:hypothetical protein [Bacteroidota bacterium]